MHDDHLKEQPGKDKDFVWNHPEVHEPARQISTENTQLFQLARQRAIDFLASDQNYRERLFIPSQHIKLFAECHRVIDYVEKACEVFADRMAFGYRNVETRGSIVNVEDHFSQVTYREFWNRIIRLASELSAQAKIKNGSMVGFLGSTGIDYIVAEYACLYLGATICPLPTTLQDGDLAQLVSQAKLEVIFSGTSCADISAGLALHCKEVSSIIIMGEASERHVDSAVINNMQDTLQVIDDRPLPSVVTLSRVEARGCNSVTPYQAFSNADDPLRLVLYTSGSSGLPKGVMFRESALVAFWKKALCENRGGDLDLVNPMPQVDVGVSYMPQNHMMGQLNVIESLAHGGSLHFTTFGDMSTLLDDIRLARPTTLTLVPRVAQTIVHAYETALAQQSRNPNADRSQIEKTLRFSLLGDRLMFMRTGTAPTGEEVAEFLKRAFEVPVYDMYGSTESGYVSFENKITHSVITDYRLVDVPELGYLGSDIPYPRGELRIKTICATAGYLHNPQATSELFDEEGFIKTGDIFEQRDVDKFIWIDRRSNIVKLAHGEFVGLWRLESLYVDESNIISQLYLYADSRQDHIVGVAVPSHTLLDSRTGQPESAIHDQLLFEFQRIAKLHHLQPYEIPRNILIEHNPFTRENGLLTDSSKPARQRLKARYQDALNQLYGHNTDKRGHFRELLMRSSGLTTREKVNIALKSILGDFPVATESTGAFKELGGDSLAAVEFCTTLAEATGVEVPIALVLDPSVDLVGVVTNFVQGVLDMDSGPVPHGNPATPRKPVAKQLEITDFLTPQEWNDAEQASPLSIQRTVLLTGANGFLGRSLVVDLLQRLPEQGRLYCLVRATTAEAALQRLLAGYAKEDPRRGLLESLVAQRKLIPIAGDLIKHHAGLSESQWADLSEEVDAIIHNGALVNHAFSYAQLFEPNVGGTAEVAKLAVSKRLKPIHFISTIATGLELRRGKTFFEYEHALSLCHAFPQQPDGGSGYAASKWAAEVLLGRISATFGIPLNIFRCGLLLPHTRIRGEANGSDTLSRLIKSISSVNLAPTSFGTTELPREIGGLPVDIASEAITSIVLSSALISGTYHVTSQSGDGINLDALLCALEKRQPFIHRSDDNKSWLIDFERRLSELSPAERAASILPIIHQWSGEFANTDPIDVSQFDTAFRSSCKRDGESDRLYVNDDRYYEKYLDDLSIPVAPGT